jgi:sugar-phosphatase
LIVTSSDVTQGKPHPEPYLKAAAELGREPQACIVVEDAPAGICAGKAAGSRVIAVRTTFNDIDLKQTAADWIVDGCHRISVVESAQGILLHLLDPLKFVD